MPSRHLSSSWNWSRGRRWRNGSPAGAVAGDLLYARVDFLRDDAGAMRLGELELVEPSLFFRHEPSSADQLADALLARLR